MFSDFAKFPALCTLALLGAMACFAGAQSAAEPAAAAQSTPLVLTGKIMRNGQSAPYLIRFLPISSFFELPVAIAAQLNQRNCMIPQTYEAHGPENVVHASLEQPGSSDWAVLCAAKGTVSLLVFFSSDPEHPFLLATSEQAERLQAHDATGVLGFNWGIDPTSPVRLHQAQAGLEHRPPLADHDALADSILDRRTFYHFFARNAWALARVAEP